MVLLLISEFWFGQRLTQVLCGASHHLNLGLLESDMPWKISEACRWQHLLTICGEKNLNSPFFLIFFFRLHLWESFWEVGPFPLMNCVGHWLNSWLLAMGGVLILGRLVISGHILGHFGFQCHSWSSSQALRVIVVPRPHCLWHLSSALCQAFVAFCRGAALCYLLTDLSASRSLLFKLYDRTFQRGKMQCFQEPFS